MRDFSGPKPRVAALTASTAAPARTRPPPVSAVTPAGCVCSARTRERSNTSTPAARTRSRSPSDSRAGWTVASSRTNSPRRKRGESHRWRTPASLSSRTRLRGATARISSITASWAGAVDAIR